MESMRARGQCGSSEPGVVPVRASGGLPRFAATSNRFQVERNISKLSKEACRRGKLRNISIEFSCNARISVLFVTGCSARFPKERLETVETTPRPRFCPFHQKKRTFSIFYILIWSFVIYSPSRYRHVYVFLVSFYRVARSVRCSLPFS